jgi:hypothetical protein
MGRILKAGAVAGLAAALGLGLAAAGSGRGKPPRLGAYRGLATWVDLYDPKAWISPETSVAAMKERGVRTLFLETGNYRQQVLIRRRALVERFVDAAHAFGLRIVAWYLPSFAKPRVDLRRSLAPIRLRTETGQRFDSFALDIEASVVRSPQRRTAGLLKLSRRIRRAVGLSYPLGAIIPSPRGMQLLPHYWPGFPYAALGKLYDVFLPMTYFSYRPRDLGGPFGYTRRGMTIIRRETGKPRVRVHPIGGLADALSAAQVAAFLRAAHACGAMGASLYDFTTTRPSGWRRLARVPRRAHAPARSCSSSRSGSPAAGG